MKVLVFFLSPQAQFAGRWRRHILFSASAIPVFIPTNGACDKALKFLGSCCFSLFGVTVSRLRWAGTVQMGLSFSAVGVCSFLKWGLSPSFIPCPLLAAPGGCLVGGNPARSHLSCVPFDPGGNSYSHPAQASYLSEHCCQEDVSCPILRSRTLCRAAYYFVGMRERELTVPGFSREGANLKFYETNKQT